jgi:hypothetical protein
VQLTRGRTEHSSGRGDVLSPRISTASRMALQCPRWSHRADGDGGDRPHWPDVMTQSCASAEQASVPLRGFHHPFSRVRRTGRTRVGGTVPRGCCRPCCTASYSGGDGLSGGVGGAVPGHDSQARRGTDSPLTWALANVSALNPPVGGAGMEVAGL